MHSAAFSLGIVMHPNFDESIAFSNRFNGIKEKALGVNDLIHKFDLRR
jgi:hypothetical protein